MAKPIGPSVARSAADLQEHFEYQLDALSSSCSRFDRGDTREYRQIATHIRTLARDTRMSKSFLAQLELKQRNFLTCSNGLAAENKLAECPLIELTLRRASPKPAEWRAVLDRAPMSFVSFDEWWEQPVMTDQVHPPFNRALLIGVVADQDGGVHVDPSIDAAFEAMRTDAFSYTDGRVTTEHPERHAIRQISHEMLKSFRGGYRRLPKERCRPLAIFRNVVLKIETPLNVQR